MGSVQPSPLLQSETIYRELSSGAVSRSIARGCGTLERAGVSGLGV
ncbi:MAG: hypothetical protein PF447_06235 [Spirochaetaceae bacterium]|nr:hypothetical protein [Spirochaetaceae bacterium]